MTPYENFFPEVLVELPDCSPDVAIMAIRNTVIEFCQKSLIYQETLDPVSIIGNIDTYDLDAPKGYRVHKVMKAWFKGSELKPLAPDDIGVPDPYNTIIGSYTGQKGPVQGYLQKDFDTVTFTPIPDQAYPNAITMRVALVPLRTSTGIADFIYEQYAEAIGFGAKARLQISPGKPYTNGDAATVNQQRFNSAVNDARQRAVRGNTRSDLMVQMRKP
jgi:hypothetical protein